MKNCKNYQFFSYYNYVLYIILYILYSKITDMCHITDILRAIISKYEAKLWKRELLSLPSARCFVIRAIREINTTMINTLNMHYSDALKGVFTLTDSTETLQMNLKKRQKSNFDRHRRRSNLRGASQINNRVMWPVMWRRRWRSRDAGIDGHVTPSSTVTWRQRRRSRDAGVDGHVTPSVDDDARDAVSYAPAQTAMVYITDPCPSNDTTSLVAAADGADFSHVWWVSSSWLYALYLVIVYVPDWDVHCEMNHRRRSLIHPLHGVCFRRKYIRVVRMSRLPFRDVCRTGHSRDVEWTSVPISSWSREMISFLHFYGRSFEKRDMSRWCNDETRYLAGRDN